MKQRFVDSGAVFTFRHVTAGVSNGRFHFRN